MNRNQLIEEVKAKLDEISPFDEPAGYIQEEGDVDFGEVKPIRTLIDKFLDKAAWFCLNNLPISQLGADISTDTLVAKVKDGVGYVFCEMEYKRLVRVIDLSGYWRRDVMQFIATDSPQYKLQQCAFRRGGACKPAVVYCPEKHALELYSFKRDVETVDVMVKYIDCNLKAQHVQSYISDYIVLMCAAYVYEALGNTNAAAVMKQEYETKIKTVM